MRIAFGCMMAKDFDYYDTWMMAKGCTLNGLADGWTRSLVEEWEDYPPDVTKRLSTESTRERLKYAWMHPAERHLEWQAVDQGSVLCGVDAVARIGGRDWPEEAYCAQSSFYSVPNDPVSAEDDRLRASRTPKTVWCQCVGKFSDGGQRRVRILFYYSDKNGCWVPAEIMTTPDGKPCPDAML
jgi:hypothetical protein